MRAFLRTCVVWVVPGTTACFALWLGLLFINPSRDIVGLNRLLPTTCNSMIFGTSRSAQGVNPHIIEQSIRESGEWLNFSFNLGASPWNETYFHAIEQKIRCGFERNTGSTFLVFVDPWSLDEIRGIGEREWLNEPWADPCDFKFLTYAVKKTNPLDVVGNSSQANLLVVFANGIPQQLKSFFRGVDSKRGVQTNGWLPNASQKSLAEKRTAVISKVNAYRVNESRGKIWPGTGNRESLTRLLKLLKTQVPSSQIYLVRPPVDQSMLQLENEWFPEANNWFQTTAQQHNVSYIDSNEEWAEMALSDFNDAHHLSIEGANRYSSFLSQRIVSDRNHSSID